LGLIGFKETHEGGVIYGERSAFSLRGIEQGIDERQIVYLCDAVLNNKEVTKDWILQVRQSKVVMLSRKMAIWKFMDCSASSLW